MTENQECEICSGTEFKIVEGEKIGMVICKNCHLVVKHIIVEDQEPSVQEGEVME